MQAHNKPFQEITKMTITRVARGCYVLALMLFAQTFAAASSDIADAAMNRNKDAVRSLLQKKVDVNSTQVDGTTALHWAVRADDLETADLLIRAGANVSIANRDGVTPMQLAAVNGTAPMIDRLIKAGANPNAPLSKFGDTALMLAARTGKDRKSTRLNSSHLVISYAVFCLKKKKTAPTT